MKCGLSNTLQQMVSGLTGHSTLSDHQEGLNFVAKFFWLIVCNKVSTMQADNILTWDMAVMVAALVAGLKIDFARMMLAEIHERAFKTSTTYPFPCLIFQMCRDAGVKIWHYDTIFKHTWTMDIGLIKDEANLGAPRRGSWIKVPLLGENLADTVELDQEADPSSPDHTDPTTSSYLHATNNAPNSSRSTPPIVSVIPLARVQNLEVQMTTLLHHIKTWMQNFIVEAEDPIEKRMAKQMEQQIQAVHKRLGSFELPVLAQPALTIDLTAIK